MLPKLTLTIVAHHCFARAFCQFVDQINEPTLLNAVAVRIWEEWEVGVGRTGPEAFVQ